MSFAEFRSVGVFERLGGLYSYLAQEDVPSAFAAGGQNLRFIPGSVLTRPGLQQLIAAPPAPAVNWIAIAPFTDNQDNRSLFLLDDQGNLHQLVLATNVRTLIRSNITSVPAVMKTAQASNRLFLAFSKAAVGGGPQAAGPVWQFNQGVLEPFVNSGPGGKNHLFSTGTLTNASTSITNVTQIATWSVGDSIFDSSGFIPSGTTVTAVNVATQTLTISAAATGTIATANLFGDGSSPSNSGAGNIVAGIHGVAISFVTRSLYITEPTPLTFWNANGISSVLVSGIPTGPPNVVARRLFFTLANQTDLYFAPAFQINDNTTTSATFNFTDVQLLASQLVNSLVNNVRLPEAAGVHVYNGRTVLWGLDNTVYFSNLGFDGGVNAARSSVPLSWIPGASVAGGSVDSAAAFYGNCWKMTGDGVTAVRGQIQQTEAAVLLLPQTAYTVRARIKSMSGLVTGTVQIHLKSASAAINLAGLQVAASSLTGTYQQFSGTLASASDLATIPQDLVLEVQLTGTPTNLGAACVDQIEIVPTNIPFATSSLYLSNAFDNETIDAVNNLIVVHKDDGQKMAAVAVLRSFCYLFKEHSMFVTSDDGVNPPAFWPVFTVDEKVGAGGPRAVVESEALFVIAARPGAYVFFGGRPLKISQEIQSIWDSINWGAANGIVVSVDTETRLVRIFTPLSLATTPNAVLTMDYVEGWGQETEPGGRKWNKDIYAPALFDGVVASDASNFKQVYYAGAKVYTVGGLNDDGVAIDSFYQTAFARDAGQNGEGSFGQTLFAGASFTIGGAGTATAQLIALGGTLIQTLATLNLSTPAQEIELYGDLESERASLKIEVNTLNSWFQMRKVTILGRLWSGMRVH